MFELLFTSRLNTTLRALIASLQLSARKKAKHMEQRIRMTSPTLPGKAINKLSFPTNLFLSAGCSTQLSIHWKKVAYSVRTRLMSSSSLSLSSSCFHMQIKYGTFSTTTTA